MKLTPEQLREIAERAARQDELDDHAARTAHRYDVPALLAHIKALEEEKGQMMTALNLIASNWGDAREIAEVALKGANNQ